MAIRDSSLRKFVFVVPIPLKREGVAEHLQKIEKNCRILQERVALKPEVVNRKLPYPIKLVLPQGVALVNSNEDRIIDFKSGIWHDPSPESLFKLSEMASVSIAADLKKFKRKHGCRLEVTQRACSLVLEIGDLSQVEKVGRIQSLQKISEILNLPLIFSEPTLPPIGHDGASVSVSDLDTDSKTIVLRCSILPQDYEEILKDLLRETKGKLDSWNVQSIGSVTFPEVIAGANRTTFPTKQVDLMFAVRLENYKTFAAMTELAAENEFGSVAQSLFEFQFESEKQGQADMVANKKGGFKLWLSFDAKEDQLEFTRLTGIKLKEDV